MAQMKLYDIGLNNKFIENSEIVEASLASNVVDSKQWNVIMFFQ